MADALRTGGVCFPLRFHDGRRPLQQVRMLVVRPSARPLYTTRLHENRTHIIPPFPQIHRAAVLIAETMRPILGVERWKDDRVLLKYLRLNGIAELRCKAPDTMRR